ncbi:MAG: flavodoxin-dependent (E)-4-hydroxy-3-methylbut-2-enyl-diphosphate synthase [Clostridiales bacterium]|jgi:(E)-4-hydroxy-3-methylbut-2-enyl-diphosphate synthase|nr:flavodoxin-dependent (E)-4-hydroxy-3-methylbut-2-enyl-diphosphate synthase [Clostridiales bacterium]
MTRKIKVGGICIGGGGPVIIQSMANADTRDVPAVSAQINALAAAGCELVRVAVRDARAAAAIAEIKRGISIPLAADIHFDYKLALAAAEAGADKLRINPGNIGGADKAREVARACLERGLPIRVGVNGGSLEDELLRKYGGPTPEALCESALRQASVLEDAGFSDIIISIKASSVPVTVAACRRLSEKTDYPLHIGLTEAGLLYDGLIKSSACIGALLLSGIGDTVRISLTDDPLEEIRAAKALLQAVGARRFGVEFISCPTCGRTEVDLIPIARRVRAACEGLGKPVTVAVMGCAVNGHKEAASADVGVSCGRGGAVLFKKGRVVANITEEEIIPRLMAEIEEL